MADDAPPRPPAFTYRAGLIGVASMVLLATWIHIHEMVMPLWIPVHVANNAPPAAAVGVFLGIMLVSALLALLAPRLKLRRGELVVIYTMLVTSAPLMSEGMWHRFIGLVAAIPHHENNLVLVDHFSDDLWPHGPDLVVVPPGELLDVITIESAHGTVDAILVDRSQIGATNALRITNRSPQSGDEPAETTLRLAIPRDVGSGSRFVPGERFYATLLVKLDGMASRSRFDLELASDSGSVAPILSIHRDTVDKFSQPGGFVRSGQAYVEIPRGTRERVDLVFTLTGAGTATIADVAFFSSEALHRLRKGSVEYTQSDADAMSPEAVGTALVRPNDLGSVDGAVYVAKGYVPYRDWAKPIAYWSVLVLAVFVALLALGVIFRRQWVDHERLSFPLVVLPRLLTEQRDERGRLWHPVFRRRSFRVGAAFAFFYAAMVAIAHYWPGMPDPTVDIDLLTYVDRPWAQAYLRGLYHSNTFKIVLMYVAIAFFVDLDVLASILIFYFLVRIPRLFGEVYGWKLISGPKDGFPFEQEQHIGSFIAVALMVLWISRRHLRGVARCVLGLPGGLDDRHEPMRYRTAAMLFLASMIVLCGWGQMTGLGAGSAMLFFGFVVMTGLVAARLRAEVGAPAAFFVPYFPFLMFYILGGLSVFGIAPILLASCIGGFMGAAAFLLFAPTQVEMFELARTSNANLKAVNWALVLGMLGGVFIGGYVMLVWYYGVGAENTANVWSIDQNWYYAPLHASIRAEDARSLSVADAGAAHPWGATAAVGVGMVVTVLLFVLRSLFAGFWLHPLGYVLANTYFIYGVWGSLLVAWAIKWAALKIGGPRLIREQLTPFFAGVFVGGVAGIVCWDLVALVRVVNGAQDVKLVFP